MNHTWKPKTQLDCDHANTLRDYEAAHKIWMNTAIHTEAGRIAKENKDAARKRYESVLEAQGK